MTRLRQKKATAGKPAARKKLLTETQFRFLSDELLKAYCIQRPLVDGLRDLLAFWDRRDESGWTAADVKRIEEIRKLVKA